MVVRRHYTELGGTSLFYRLTENSRV